MRTFARFLKLILMAVLLCSGNAHADIRQIFYTAATGQPSWKLENYPGNVVAIWNTPSSCTEGSLGFSADVTISDKNRFYVTLLAAKTSNVTMFIYYNELPGSCNIVSFGLM